MNPSPIPEDKAGSLGYNREPIGAAQALRVGWNRRRQIDSSGLSQIAHRAVL